jgi:hypothetical protein
MSRIFLIVTLVFVFLGAQPAIAQLNGRTLKEGRESQVQNVRFGSVSAISEGNGVLIRWSTEYERDNLGFTVYRATAKGWEKLGYNIVPGNYFSIDPQGTYGRDYRFFDPKGDLSSTYLVEAQPLAGSKVNSSIFFTAFESNFVEIAGADSQTMVQAALSAQPITAKGIVSVSTKQLASRMELGTLDPNLPMQHWVAAQPGVKIGVKNEGFYRVSKIELENAGFDVNADRALWQLYLNGNQQSIVVEPNGDYIEFYGKGIDTRSTNTNIYFLVVGTGQGNRIQSVERPSTGGGTAISYVREFYRRDRSIYVTSIKNGSKENFFGQVISPTPVLVNIPIDQIDYSNLKSNILIAIQGFTGVSHKVSVRVNGVPFGSLQFNGAIYKVADIGIPTAILVEGNNTVELTGIGGSSDISVVESVTAKYRRKYTAVGNELKFSVEAQKAATIAGFGDSSVRVFDVTAPDSPSFVSNVVAAPAAKLGPQYTVTVPANAAAMMLAVTNSAVKTVDSISYNSPSTISSSANSSRMVIVSNGGWTTESQTWADYRQNSGLDTIVIDVEDVYDEFGYGIKGSNAIKEFINFARQNWSVAPDYVMLVGDTTYDPRNYTGGGLLDFLPTEMIETSYEETGSDEAIADYDEDGLSEIAIGRVPAKTGLEVTNALAKVTTFESSLASAPARGSLCASDLTQIVDFAALCARVQAELPNTIPAAAVNRGDVDAKATLIAQMNLGKYIINYSGHGSTIAWTSGNFFKVGDVPTLTNQNDLSIYTMLTCLNGYFINGTTDSLSETLFKATNGGAVATWASSGSTTPDIQEILARRFYSQLGNNPAMDRIGDLVKDAKTAIVAGRDVRLSWTLLGDPAMKVK